MTTTLAEFKVIVARALQDPEAETFTDDMLEDLIGDAIVEIGTFAPNLFTDDIDLVADTLSYQLLPTVFADPEPDISLIRVELWDGTATPEKFLTALQCAGNQPLNQTDAGWRVWNGTLYLTNLQENAIDPAKHVLRVTGYSPYALPDFSDENAVIPLPPVLLRAAKAYCRVEGLELLSASRELFTQWQTRSGNSDISYAGLMNGLSLARQTWKSRSRSLARVRQLPT